MQERTAKHWLSCWSSFEEREERANEKGESKAQWGKQQRQLTPASGSPDYGLRAGKLDGTKLDTLNVCASCVA